VAEALARIRNAELPAALASMVFVCRAPTETPTGRYIGCVHFQRLLREPPAELVASAVDTNLPAIRPAAPLAEVTRYFAAYNLACAPVVDAEDHLLGAITVDDVLDHLLPEDWRVTGLHDIAGGSGGSEDTSGKDHSSADSEPISDESAISEPANGEPITDSTTTASQESRDA
jgi:Mg/Co/Ni transporter MgtE